MCIKNCSAMKISINAPSYKRPSKVLTLDYLPMCRIWVDCKEYDEYKKHYPKADIVSCPEGVQGNVGRIRNYILRQEFERGMDAVVIVDDDLTAIERFVCRNGYGYERERVQAEDFMDFVERYSIMCQDIGAKLWGVNITPDTMAYRYTSPFSTRAIILGPFGCFLKGNRCWYDERLPLKTASRSTRRSYTFASTRAMKMSVSFLPSILLPFLSSIEASATTSAYEAVRGFSPSAFTICCL